MKEHIERYFDARKSLHAAFGYVEDWAVIPMDDQRDAFWCVVGGEAHGGKVYWSDQAFEDMDIALGKDLYSGPIYTQRHLPKWVYRANGYALISVDTECDLNRCLFVFDERKECKDKDILRKLKEHWG
jgi:hypothetical protein